MVSLILYACIAKGSTIVAEFSREPTLSETALKCIEQTPPYHSIFSHTVGKRTYTFLIHNPFAYFAIFSDDLDRAEGLRFLNRLKQAFEEKIQRGSIKDSGNLAPRCFQRQADPIFAETLVLDSGPSSDLADSVAPLLGKGLKKKKRAMEIPNGKDEASIEMNNGYRDLAQPVHKSAPILFPGSDRQRAKQVWKKHVWVVLMLDLFLCSILFGIWLWVCRGLHCIHA